MKTVPDEIMNDAAMAAIAYMQLKGLRITKHGKQELAAQVLFN
jgi:hypothetical protein